MEQRESLWHMGVGVGGLPPLQIGGWGAAHLLCITSSELPRGQGLGWGLRSVRRFAALLRGG